MSPKRKASPKRSSAASKKGSGRSKGSPSRTPVRAHLAPWARDAFGIALVVLALLSVLALWFDAAGVAGRGIEWALEGAFGLAAIVFPVVGIWWGIVLLRGSEEEERLRMFIGFALATAGILGIVSIVNGNPAPADGWDGGGGTGIAEAGGLLGALVGWPLATTLSALGGGIVCGGLAFLGLLIFFGTPLSQIWVRVKEIAASEAISRAFGLRAGDDEQGLIDDPTEPVHGRRVLRSDEDDASNTIIVPDAGDAGVVAEPAPAKVPLPVDELESESPAPVAPTVAAAAATKIPQDAYELPPLDLLRAAPSKEADTSDEEHTMDALERTFSTFGVEARVPTAHRGPTVTLYEVEVGAGTKVNKVLNLSDDIAYALATPDVRIIAPIPGKSAIGVEVPNKVRDFVTLGDILRSKVARDDTAQLAVALGKDVHGRAQMVNLGRMPHVLIAGATGAGKSSLINSFVTSILMRTDPDEVKLVLIDPKRVELSHFADLPHLLSPVIVHPKRAAEALGWVVREMENRYELLAMCGVRDIDGYREGLQEGTLRIPPGQEEKFVDFPYLVVVIDELADLMMVAPRDVEDAICRIAQMARAVGIHLVVATQRPSVDVVTGLIKANIPSRIALMTSSQADSRVILDSNGAEKLVGHGDMLYAPANASKPSRLQAAWVTEKEIHAVAEWIRAQREVVYEATVEGLGKAPTAEEEAAAVTGGVGDDDDLLRQAAELVIRSQLGSTSMLQRKLKVGFARAGRLMDLMEERGIVGPSQGSKARDVLLTWEEWEQSRSTARSA
ncbi:MAG: DNA translocase FtsK 4TM domain-containing protein [Actinomycetota bacterium]